MWMTGASHRAARAGSTGAHQSLQRHARNQCSYRCVTSSMCLLQRRLQAGQGGSVKVRSSMSRSEAKCLCNNRKTQKLRSQAMGQPYIHNSATTLCPPTLVWQLLPHLAALNLLAEVSEGLDSGASAGPHPALHLLQPLLHQGLLLAATQGEKKEYSKGR
jgi:hypothetical protein